jgi:hypothetical protein
LRHIEVALESFGLFWILCIHNLFGIAKAKLTVFFDSQRSLLGNVFPKNWHFISH